MSSSYRTIKLWVASASAGLPMVCPFAIGKAWGLAAPTRRHEILNRNPPHGITQDGRASFQA